MIKCSSVLSYALFLYLSLSLAIYIYICIYMLILFLKQWFTPKSCNTADVLLRQILLKRFLMSSSVLIAN